MKNIKKLGIKGPSFVFYGFYFVRHKRLKTKGAGRFRSDSIAAAFQAKINEIIRKLTFRRELEATVDKAKKRVHTISKAIRGDIKHNQK